jgi:hypothetical protein
MPMLSAITAISGSYPDITVIPNKNLFEKNIYINRHFFPRGEPISPHLLRCSPFAVDNHSFMVRRLASAATSTRE